MKGPGAMDEAWAEAVSVSPELERKKEMRVVLRQEAGALVC